MDTIYIKDLEVFANHGVYPEENKLGSEVCDPVRIFQWMCGWQA